MATRRHPPILKPSESPTRPPNILEFFRDWLHFQPSPYQTVLLKTLFGIPLVGGEWVIYQRATGRGRYYRLGFTEATIISGARGGKSILAAGIILYHAFFSKFVPGGPGSQEQVPETNRRLHPGLRFIALVIEGPLDCGSDR